MLIPIEVRSGAKHVDDSFDAVDDDLFDGADDILLGFGGRSLVGLVVVDGFGNRCKKVDRDCVNNGR